MSRKTTAPSSAISFATDSRIDDTFAEAFEMRFARIIVTAIDRYWLETAAAVFCGYGTSVIGCDAECGIERFVGNNESDDGRPGVSILAFGFSTEALEKAIVNRAGQCLMTCPTTAVFNGHLSDKPIALGKQLRFFGDGFQKSKQLGDRRFWRVPVMDGEFIVEELLGVGKGIAGCNFIIAGSDAEKTLAATRQAVDAINNVAGCITPFPGGIARSGSKVGSRYSGQVASTNENCCPTLQGRVVSQLPDTTAAAYEVVIDGVDEEAVRLAMRAGITAALNSPHADQILTVTAGNYGGKLGKCLIPLREL